MAILKALENIEYLKTNDRRVLISTDSRITLESLKNRKNHTYEGDSNENLKSAIRIQNTARLSCKLTIMILMVRRVADRWQYDARMQHDGEVVV
jgi:hypothetical protein